MLGCTRFETHAIMTKKANGIVRRYDPKMGCPHKAGSKIHLTTETVDEDGKTRQIPFAQVTIISVRPGTVKAFRKDKMLHKQDGHENGAAWYTHLSHVLYRGISDDTKVYHITFKMDKVEKKVSPL